MVTRRNLTLVFMFLLLWILLALVMPMMNASAAPSGDETYVVTRLDDPAPNGCQVGDCSLCEALMAADTPALNTVTFAVTGTIEITAGELEIHGSTILQGNGPENTIIDANGLSGVLVVLESSPNPAPWCMPTIRDVTITGGTTSGIGVESDCTFSLYDSVVRNNSSPTRGGGISHTGVGVLVATIANSAIISNTAPNGGGIFMEHTFLDITNTTISGNSATDKGGGLYYGGDFGSGRLVLTHVTIANNTAAQGNEFAFEDQTTPQNIVPRIFNSIIAHDLPGSACATIGINTLQLDSLGYNLSTDQSCQFTESSDLENTNPYLPPLQLHTGTYVHVPALNSPALDSGSAGNLTTDQRGLPRPVDLAGLPNTNDGADRGAYEHQSVPPTAVTLTEFWAQSDSPSPFAFPALVALAAGIAWGRKRRRHL
jgi:hypothetical protein